MTQCWKWLGRRRAYSRRRGDSAGDFWGDVGGLRECCGFRSGRWGGDGGECCRYGASEEDGVEADHICEAFEQFRRPGNDRE